ncbi:SH3 beta-barrel fold-containing protein [Porphyromonas somerae]|uniref:SH3 beta-barrel fold-containing protein n=1 Tax=Porphyromonas somerae TaxID=322095 RepID=UPI001FCC0803|nr:SH3 beta-barrel fold-containing protein [Porphyromonas somerae]BDE81293.1 hypothetical protein CE91St14_03210 [Porphyromonas somerae]
MSKTNRIRLSEVMSKAWYLFRTYGTTFSDALKRAWAWFKLRAQMLSGVVEFWFTKSDGTQRQAFGTLRSDLISEVKGGERKHYEHLQTYWDTEKQAFRSFKLINLAI